MPVNITLKNIPDDLYERLKLSARAHRRSINSEVIVSLERALVSQQIDPDEMLVMARKLRKKTERRPITDEDLSGTTIEGQK
jgi:plasmid stability protein